MPTRPLLPIVLALSLLLLHHVPATALQRQPPPVPDLTAGGTRDEAHDWNLGPTGARGWMWGWNLETTNARQILVTAVAAGSPSDGVLEVGDVILGIGDAPFERDPRRALGEAIGAAEAATGALELLVWRDGRTQRTPLALPALGNYAATAPFDCVKSDAILDAACAHIAANMKGDIDGMMNALALLATGRDEYAPLVRDLAREVAKPDPSLTLEGRTSGLFAWRWGYRALFLCEYFLATGDDEVLPAITDYARTMAQGQSGVGTWGHGMAWPDLNDGELNGRLGGYGALNQSGLVCHLSLVLARLCGVQDPDVDAAIERANRFAAFYVGKGAIPYGDHRPGWDAHDDNGKNSLAAIIFDLQGLREEARFFAKMATASWGERERGHTGNYFSYLWGPLGVARVGHEAVTAFLAEQRWFYDLNRAHDGRFPYQGGAGMTGGEHQYGNWDCTGVFVLANTVQHRRLFITGRGVDPEQALAGDELEATIEAGRGFDAWDLGAAHYAAKGERALLDDLSSWSPAVRSRAAVALAQREDVPVDRLVRRLSHRDLDVRYGACQALAELGPRAAEAVPALTELLASDDVWLRIQACFALADIGDAARSAAPAMLRLALTSDPNDPREFTQRFLAFTLFYKGGALNMRGLLARDLDGIDRDLLLPALERLLANDDGRARACLESAYRNLAFDELAPILPAIVEAIREPSPSGVMFANGIRLSGLELLGRNRVDVGMALCLDSMDVDEWGKQDRIKKGLEVLRSYGGAAHDLLPRLRALEETLANHREAKGLVEHLKLCRETIAAIGLDGDPAPLVALDEVVAESRRALEERRARLEAQRRTREARGDANTLKVFVLAGQSNMVGAGQVNAREDRNGGQGSLEHLVRDAATAPRFAHLIDDEGAWVRRDDVWIDFFEREGPLTVGYGSRADTIGPELGFGHVIGEAFDEPVLLIKIAWGGKSLAVDFRPPSAGGDVGPNYTQLVDGVREVLADLDEGLVELEFDGYELVGVGWHQGWNDRIDQAFNDAYEDNMAHFIRDLRVALEAPDLPFVIAETGMNGPDETHPRALSLMAAQRAVTEQREFRRTTAFVPTQDFWRPAEASPSGQGYHWNSNAETYYLIGDAMGRAMAELLGVEVETEKAKRK